MSPNTNVLQKIDSCSCKKAARELAKTVGKDSGGESVGLHCLQTKRLPYTSWKLVKLLLKMRALAVHSNAFPYFTELPVSSSL